MNRLNSIQEHVSVAAAKNIETWLTQPKYFEYKEELNELIDDEKWQELEDSFYKVIEFGTGGRRGVVGIGSNRINKVTIGESTQALCEYAKSYDSRAPFKGIVIGCDTRLSSDELSKYTACVAAENGFKVYIFDSFRSTPEVSFAVRKLGAAIGVVITASHNAPEYNGFKAYWSDGAQLVPPHDVGVLKVAADIAVIHVAKDFEDTVADGRIIIIDDEIDQSYYTAVLAESMGSNHDLRIAYSPLHGAGQRNTLPVLQAAGFDVLVEKRQMVPDGHFPTMKDGRANPEKRPANDLVVALMLAEKADIAVSNDPDADRIAVIVRQDDRAVYLSGNQTAVLVTEYSLRKMAEQSLLTPQHYIVKTIVTTDMLNAVARNYSVECVGNLHVGFKWICEVVNKREAFGGKFITGSEESFGLMKGSYTRDKDGAVALIIAEYAAELKAEGKTLYDRLLELYEEYGVYTERLDTVVCEGSQGFDDMQTIMKSLRANPPLEVDGHKVTAVLDYALLTKKDIGSAAESKIDCIAGNVLVFEFGDSRCRITVRPSGTEPIMKFYVQWFEQSTDIVVDVGLMDTRLEGMSREFEEASLQRLKR